MAAMPRDAARDLHTRGIDACLPCCHADRAMKLCGVVLDRFALAAVSLLIEPVEVRCCGC